MADFSPIGADFGDFPLTALFLIQNHRKARKAAIPSGRFSLVGAYLGKNFVKCLKSFEKSHFLAIQRPILAEKS